MMYYDTFYVRILLHSWSSVNEIIIDETANDQINVNPEHYLSTADSSQKDLDLDVSGRTSNELPLQIGCNKDSGDANVYET